MSTKRQSVISRVAVIMFGGIALVVAIGFGAAAVVAVRDVIVESVAGRK